MMDPNWMISVDVGNSCLFFIISKICKTQGNRDNVVRVVEYVSWLYVVNSLKLLKVEVKIEHVCHLVEIQSLNEVSGENKSLKILISKALSA